MGKRPASNASSTTSQKSTCPEDYLEKRAKNNEAVKRSRTKSRTKESEDAARVQELKRENAELERRAEVLKKELAFLKEMFVSFANSSAKNSNPPS